MVKKIQGFFSSLFYRDKHDYYDYSIILMSLILLTFGLVMVYSTTAYSDALTQAGAYASVKKQAKFAVGAIVFMFIVSKIDYHVILKLAPVISGFVLFGCVLVFFLGVASHGATRWIKIGGASVQPSEFAKGALIVFLARYIPLKMIPQKRSDFKKEMKSAMCIIGIACVFAAPVIGENLSTGIIILLIGAIMAYIPNRKGYMFWIVLIAGLIALYFGWTSELIKHMLKEYQVSRVTAWLDPEAGASESSYQVLQGLYAIGSGGLFGKGLGSSIQKLGFLPEAQNDMIFAIICEEFGLFGAFLVILAYGYLIVRFFNLSHRAPDMSGSMLILGVMIHIGIQVAMNIAVVTNSMPNTGVALPFISSGGSALISMFAEIGLVLSVTNQISE